MLVVYSENKLICKLLCLLYERQKLSSFFQILAEKATKAREFMRKLILAQYIVLSALLLTLPVRSLLVKQITAADIMVALALQGFGEQFQCFEFQLKLKSKCLEFKYQIKTSMQFCVEIVEILQCSPQSHTPEIVNNHYVKSVRIRRFSGPCFLAFGLSISPYSVLMREKKGSEKLRKRTLFTQ